MAVCFNFYGHFWNIDISQGSVATWLRCGGILKYEFVANLSLSLSVEEFWKSVWGSYGQEFSVLFFDSQCLWHSSVVTRGTFWVKLYTLCPQKSEPPKHVATATANLHRFKWNFTHTRRHLFLSSTSNFIRIPYSVYELFNFFKLLSQISVTDTSSSLRPLPDPWRRPSERTIDWRSEHYWQSSESVAWSTA